MSAFDVLIKRRNAVNNGWEEVQVPVGPGGTLCFDNTFRPEVITGLANASTGPGTIATQNGTLTAALLLGGQINHTVITGAGTDTFDTAANIIAALTTALGAAPAVGFEFTCMVVNTAASALAITFAVAAGVTIRNVAQTVTQNGASKLYIRVTGAATVDVFIG